MNEWGELMAERKTVIQQSESVIASGGDLKKFVAYLWSLTEEARWGDEILVKREIPGSTKPVFSSLMEFRISRNRHDLPPPLSTGERRFTINLPITPASVRGMEHIDGYLLELQDVSNLLGFTEFALTCKDAVELILDKGSLKLERICDHPEGHSSVQEQISRRVLEKIKG